MGMEIQNHNLDQIADEILQITSQYQAEVPNERRSWPRSIRNRALELRNAGWKTHRISKRTGIPRVTLYAWYRRAKAKAAHQQRIDSPPGFIPVAVSSMVKQCSTVKQSTTVKQGVIALLPGDIRVEGATPEFLAEFVKRLRGWP